MVNIIIFISQSNQQSGKEERLNTRSNKETYEDGSRYEGDIQGELRHGQGKLMYRDGSLYDGHWVLDRMSGYGVLYYADKRVAYEGEWKNNQREGNGTMYSEFADEMKENYVQKAFEKDDKTWVTYEGDFSGDDWHGLGKLTFSNGDVYQGRFRKGKMHGRGTYVQSGGEVIVGEWANNRSTQTY